MGKNYRGIPLEIRFGEFSALPKAEIPARVQLFRVGSFYPNPNDPTSKIPITSELLFSMKANFEKRVRGIDLAIDYAHESDKEAAGWIQNVFLENENQELWAEVKWNPKGQEILINREYRYISPDFSLNYKDNEQLAEHGPTLLGAGLTNRPVIKEMTPVIELSENTHKYAEDLQTCVSNLIPELINQGHDQEQAIAIAYSKCGEKKLNELESRKSMGDKKMPELKEPEKKAAEPAAVTAAEMSPEEMKTLIEQLKAEIAALRGDKEMYMNEKKMAEQKSKFDKLLSEGKAVEAQREPFMSNDALKFAELAQPVNLQPKGSAEIPVVSEVIDAEAQVLKFAEQQVKEGKAKTLGDGISNVLKSNADLRKKYEAKSI